MKHSAFENLGFTPFRQADPLDAWFDVRQVQRPNVVEFTAGEFYAIPAYHYARPGFAHVQELEQVADVIGIGQLTLLERACVATIHCDTYVAAIDPAHVWTKDQYRLAQTLGIQLEEWFDLVWRSVRHDIRGSALGPKAHRISQRYRNGGTA